VKAILSESPSYLVNVQRRILNEVMRRSLCINITLYNTIMRCDYRVRCR
jgi:hypothetical protein